MKNDSIQELNKLLDEAKEIKEKVIEKQQTKQQYLSVIWQKCEECEDSAECFLIDKNTEQIKEKYCGKHFIEKARKKEVKN